MTVLYFEIVLMKHANHWQSIDTHEDSYWYEDTMSTFKRTRYSILSPHLDPNYHIDLSYVLILLQSWLIIHETPYYARFPYKSLFLCQLLPTNLETTQYGSCALCFFLLVLYAILLSSINLLFTMLFMKGFDHKTIYMKENWMH